MTSRSTSLSVALITLALFGTCSIHAAEKPVKDTVLLRGRATVQGVVLRDGWDAVAVDTSGDGKADKKLPALDVASITYGDTPDIYRQAMFLYKGRRYAEALALFEKAAEDASPRAFWFKPATAYHLAECRRRISLEDKDALTALAKSFDAIAKQHAQSRMAPAALYSLGRCHLALGNMPSADAAFSKLLEQGKYARPWPLLAKLGRARFLSAGKKFNDAIALCREVVEDAPTLLNNEDATEAFVTLSYVLTSAGQYDEARRIHMDMARQADEKDVRTRARAYNAIGDICLAENKTDDALLAYLRVRVLFFQDREQLPRALFGAAHCFTVLKKPAQARSIVALLKKDHPKNPWTLKAVRELGD
jgi:tetratricopeptide (TPR) repeat protein